MTVPVDDGSKQPGKGKGKSDSLGIREAFESLAGGFAYGMHKLYMDSISAGHGVPKMERGTMPGQFVGEALKRGYNSSDDVAKALDGLRKLKGINDDDPQTKASRLNSLINQLFPIRDKQAAASENPTAATVKPASESKSPRSSKKLTAADVAELAPLIGGLLGVGNKGQLAMLGATVSKIASSGILSRPNLSGDLGSVRTIRPGGSGGGAAGGNGLIDFDAEDDLERPADSLGKQFEDLTDISAEVAAKSKGLGDAFEKLQSKVPLGGGGGAGIGGGGGGSGDGSPPGDRDGDGSSDDDTVADAASGAATAFAVGELAGPEVGAAVAAIYLTAKALRFLIDTVVSRPINKLAGMLGHGQSVDSARPGDRHMDVARSAGEGFAEIEEEVPVIGGLMAALTRVSVSMALLPRRLEMFGQSLLASQEPLRRFNGQIAAAFARLERTNLLIDRDTAGATSGTTTALADAIGSLSQELQPIKQTVITGVNTLGLIGVNIGRGVAFLIKMSPAVQGIIQIAQLLEKWFGAAPKAGPWEDLLKDITDGKFKGGGK